MSKKSIPSVLAFEKKIVPSDALMYHCNGNNKSELTPLKLQEKSVRGTISNRLKKAIANDPAKLDAEVEKANLQKVDSCALPQDKDTLAIKFTVKILGNLLTASTCNNAEFQHSLRDAVTSYLDEHQCTELAKRYAYNLANARFLWRNRVGVENLTVNIKVLNEKLQQEHFDFDATQFSLKTFDSSNSQLDKLASFIVNALASENDFLLLEVTCYAKIGLGQEVYPSEELVLDKANKKNGDKSKILYAVNAQAAMHSQKIGNAIRTIDTWFPHDANMQYPIAIEPYGAVTTLGKAFRNPKSGNDFYTLFDAWATGTKTLTAEENHYVIAMLIRGGVFGASSKEL